MKTLEIVAYRTFQIWNLLLISTLVFALGYALVQLAIGNYSGTACREF